MKPRGEQHQRVRKPSPRSGLVQQAPAANSAMMPLCHADNHWRGVAEVRRYLDASHEA